jgi:hypothetical protein
LDTRWVHDRHAIFQNRCRKRGSSLAIFRINRFALEEYHAVAAAGFGLPLLLPRGFGVFAGRSVPHSDLCQRSAQKWQFLK